MDDTRLTSQHVRRRSHVLARGPRVSVLCLAQVPSPSPPLACACTQDRYYTSDSYARLTHFDAADTQSITYVHATCSVSSQLLCWSVNRRTRMRWVRDNRLVSSSKPPHARLSMSCSKTIIPRTMPKQNMRMKSFETQIHQSKSTALHPKSILPRLC